VHPEVARLGFSAIVVANRVCDEPVISPGLATELGPPVTTSDMPKRGERHPGPPALGINSETSLAIGLAGAGAAEWPAPSKNLNDRNRRPLPLLCSANDLAMGDLQGIRLYWAGYRLAVYSPFD
jgi:hypothetical protein